MVSLALTHHVILMGLFKTSICNLQPLTSFKSSDLDSEVRVCYSGFSHGVLNGTVTLVVPWVTSVQVPVQA